ncbi:MAG: hypothetical protein ACK4SN_04225 [Bellilinea sp.]
MNPNILYFLIERLDREPVTRLFVSYEGVQPLDESRVQALKRLFNLPGVLPALIGAPSLDELRAALPLEGVFYAGRHGAVFHEPEEKPDRLANHLRLSRCDPSAVRRVLTAWALANRSPADAFAVYIGCAEFDLPAMQLIEDLNGWAVFSSRDCFSTGVDGFKQPALQPVFG